MAEPREVRDFVHGQVHRGKLHSFSDASMALADGGSIGIVIWAGDEDMHIVYGVVGGGKGRVRLYEDATITASTVMLSSCGMNRNKKASASLSASIGHTPTFTVASASLLRDEAIPGTTGGNRSGGAVRSGDEWVLATSTKYIIAACNLSGGAAAFSIVVEGYEH